MNLEHCAGLIKHLAAPYQNLPIRQQARMVIDKLQRYHQSRWRQDREQDPNYTGQESQTLHGLLQATDGAVPDTGTVRSALEKER